MIIGVYDSGLGGVDILNKLIHKYPKHTYIYVADNKYCPYGIRYNDELLKRVNRVMDFFVHQKVDFVVVACNTVSNIILGRKNDYQVPIFTILEANIHLLEQKRFHQVSIIATSNLIRSEIFNLKLNSDIQYINGSLLVKYIEENNQEKIKNEIHTLMKCVSKDSEAVLLACTHFPLYKDLFISREYKKFILEGSKDLIYSLPIKNDSNIQSIHIFLTKNDKEYETKIENILKDYHILIHNIAL